MGPTEQPPVQQPSPTIPVQPPEVPAMPPEPVSPPPMPVVKKKLPVGLIIGFTVLFLLVFGGMVFVQSRANRAVTPVAVVTPTEEPTPTIASRLSPIATSAAFLQFDSNLASLSATINAFSLSDGSLTPPTIDLDLGLSNK